MTFKNLGLSNNLLKAIDKKGYTTPSPIQEKAIPPVLEGKDVLASAQTGTGKTAGFTLPLLHLLSEQKALRHRPVRALILTPTRELAAQIFANVKEYSEFLDLRSAVIFGGVNQKPQIANLKRGMDVLVATPGRLLDLHNQRFLSLDKVEIFVLDEADRMLDMGFLRDIERVMKLIPAKRQNLMFSATFSKDIKKLAHGILNNPIQVEATPENTAVEVIKQKVYRVAKGKKTGLIIKLISDGNWQQVLVFTRTKHGANNLCKKMSSKGISAAAIHGNKSQGARTKALDGFKKGTLRVLVATDIAARGLDIPLLPHVINYEIPNISEDYVHRIGRTGRAGASGEAVSLVSADETTYLKDIQKLIGMQIPVEIVEGFEPDPNASTKPIKQGQRNNRSRSSSSKPKGGASKNNTSNNRRPKRNNDRRSNNKRN
ncbi:ATP-dependent RNA helicase RhlE [Cellulophaga lytica]|uniref:DEAD-box ATP-dependent RNA helicase RhpA n=1 Tax=Cellulophaga lytica (strain ATCC 23178 / DSM 7489 / JCM 8516 / NBRC 14961 / NCIMB 1423 / VKM B-1433 / Cy l20) TaxID=867900 RepID=F0RFF6_CELLC|nr:DEAD/DEAH box helicase [Cellulophaga lytica]ADY27898.1 DEAD/DEAH box helicase domain protein [Cellulophaga lytica DSM 7489]AIM62142.1 ATP-dependent RNA helicase RhlE [Cellulophaga lytica]WQG77910.1 DEAD/DEAH box helicase [Cellulophaga lytica]